MGCFPFANSRFQMGVTVMGFAEHFGLYPSLIVTIYIISHKLKNGISVIFIAVNDGPSEAIV